MAAEPAGVPTTRGGALDLEAVRAAALVSDPFDHIHVPRAVHASALAAIHRDFPRIDQGGSFPEATLRPGPAFAALVDELRGPGFRAAMAQAFAMDLDDKPTMVTVRGQCRLTDGKIHTDSRGKLLTVLLYLNDGFTAPDGHLRLLRGGDSLDDYAAEIAPGDGTLLAFRCTPDAWHGHTPFAGQRRAIQLNWVRDAAYVRRERARHRLSALFKRARG